jgi:hypothetical protein
MMIMKKILILLTGLIILSYYGCQKYDNPIIKVTSTYPLNGEFWVQFDKATITGTDTTWTLDPYGLGYKKIIIANTSSDKGDSIIVYDSGDPKTDIWPFKVKAACNVNALTFSAINAREYYSFYNITGSNGIFGPDTTGIYLNVNKVKYGPSDTTNIKNGKIFTGKGLTKGGNKTDSIFMLIHWASDPTDLYRISGVRRTGFKEDDY